VLIRLRSWQLAALLYGPVVVAFILFDPRNSVHSGMNEAAMTAATLWASFLTLFWVWMVGRTLADMKRDRRRSNTLFHIGWSLTATATGVFLLLIVADLMQLDTNEWNPQVLAGISLVLTVIVFGGFLGLVYVTGYTAKRIAEVEYFPLKVSLIDYVGSIIAIWFFPIGVWFLQPRLNQIALNWENQRHDPERVSA